MCSPTASVSHWSCQRAKFTRRQNRRIDRLRLARCFDEAEELARFDADVVIVSDTLGSSPAHASRSAGDASST